MNYICICRKLKISGLIPLVILIFLNLRILSRWSFPSHPHLTKQTQKNTNPETNTHSLPSLISLPFMPCISCNSEKLEESSLPPRAGQEHCQQQFHHRFVCLHLFFPSTTFSPSDKLRERRATQQSRDCNLAIILISTVVMFFLCHLPRVVTRLVFFTLLWSPSPTPWPTSSSPTQSSAFMRRRTSTPSSIAGKEVYLEF